MNARSFQAMVPMRDGTRLNTFVFRRRRTALANHRSPYALRHRRRRCAAQI
jgi:predicted acyl esterase